MDSLVTVFVDSWGWLTLADRREARHSEVAQFFANARSEGVRLVTSDYVLSEVITRAFQRAPFLQAKRFLDGLFDSAQRGPLELEQVDRRRFHAAWALRLRYDDQPEISFPDLTSFAIMREMGIETVLTQDRHFTFAGFTLVP